MAIADAPTPIRPQPAVGWLADPDTTDEVDLGSCRCPGTPHERDSAQVRTDYGDGEVRAIYEAATAVTSSGLIRVLEAVGDDLAIAKFTISWTLLDGEGKPIPINAQVAGRLKGSARNALLAVINPAIERAGGELPNASGGRSPGSSQERGRRTRTTPRRR